MSASAHGGLLLVLVFILCNLVPLEYAEGKFWSTLFNLKSFSISKQYIYIILQYSTTYTTAPCSRCSIHLARSALGCQLDFFATSSSLLFLILLIIRIIYLYGILCCDHIASREIGIVDSRQHSFILYYPLTINSSRLICSFKILPWMVKTHLTITIIILYSFSLHR